MLQYTSFLNCQCILLFNLSYHYWDLSSSYCSLSFHFHLQDSSISCMVKNPSVLFILDCINFLLLKDSFSRQDSWLTFFSFSISNIAVHCLLASKASDEMPAIILLRIPCMWGVVSPLLFSRFSLSLGFKSVSYGILSSFYLEFIQLLGCLYIYLSSNFRNFWPLMLQIFPLPFCCLIFWGSYKASVVYLMVSHRLLKFYSLFLNLFSFCFSDIIFIALPSDELVLFCLLKSAFESF